MNHFAQLDENNVVTQVIVVTTMTHPIPTELKQKASVLLSVETPWC